MPPLKHTQSGRGASRFAAGLSAEVRLPAAKFSCTVHDLSRSGALLTGKFPAPPDERVGVVLSSSAGDLRIQLKARVARVMTPGDSTSVGVEFRDLTTDDRQRIERLLSRIIEGSGNGMLSTLDGAAKSDEIRAALAGMPAAHRIGIAARAQARERRFLREDTNPLVLEALARNPNGTAEEAVALARRPMLRPGTVDILANERRFQRNEELQLLLAAHPQATLQTAEKIVVKLSPRGKARLLTRPNLHPVLRRKLVNEQRPRTRY